MPPGSTELCSWDDLAAEVAAGRMMWSGSAQSGTDCPSFSEWQAAVANDGLNPDSYPSNELAPYAYLLAHAVVQPTNVVLSNTSNCGTCSYSMSLTFASRPSGWDALVQQNGVGGYTNIGTVNSLSIPSGLANFTSYFYNVKYSNGVTTTPIVASNTVNINCTSCPP